MDIRLLAERMYEHWSRKLLANVLLYCAIIGAAITWIYPKLESFNLAGLSKLDYGLTVILPCPFLVLVYALFVKNRNKISSVRHLLDIFPTYASVVRLLAAFLIAFWAIFQPSLRSLAATYIMIVLLAGTLSFFPVYYDITFRFIRVVIDVVLATLVYVHFGGINSPFVLLYFLPVTIAARYFDPASSRLVAILAVLLLLVFTFLDFHNPERSWVENASQYIPQFGVISVLIFPLCQYR